jgi:hypothetical protein
MTSAKNAIGGQREAHPHFNKNNIESVFGLKYFFRQGARRCCFMEENQFFSLKIFS